MSNYRLVHKKDGTYVLQHYFKFLGYWLDVETIEEGA